MSNAPNDPTWKAATVAQQYLSLDDAAEVTGDKRYGASGAEVWYTKPVYPNDFSMGVDWLRERGVPLPNAHTIKETHALVGTVGEHNLEDIFVMMQGDVWSPNGEARNLIRGRGLKHTSMMVGDIVKIGSTLHMVDSSGFEKVAAKEAAVERDLQIRQVAYALAKSATDDPDMWDPRTRKLAARYFDLVHKSGSEAERLSAAVDLEDQFNVEREAAENLVKVAQQYAVAFANVAGVHRKLMKG